jgi:DNA-binding beta-propeller fold protein YncE
MSAVAVAEPPDDELDHELITVHADPDALALDPHEGTLYVADASSGAIIRVDGDLQRRVTLIDTSGVISSNRIGGIAITPYGTLFVTRLGYGRAGAVLRVEPDGQAEEISSLSPTWWRLGMAYDPYEHALYMTQFQKAANGPSDGAILRIDLATNRPSILISGLLAPVGIAALGGSLVITDAQQRGVYRVDVRDGRAESYGELAVNLDGPDSVCACGRDSVLMTTYDEANRLGSVRQLWLDGRMRTIACGFWQPRGVATDGERVFVASRRSGHVLVFRL